MPLTGRTAILILVLGALVLTWAGIFAFVVTTRALYDVHRRIVENAVGYHRGRAR